MNAKLELYRRYYCVYRNIHPFSILIEWADAYILQIGYEDHIYELSIAQDRKEASCLSEKILDEITFNSQRLEIESISDNTSLFDALPRNTDNAGLLGERYNHQEYQIGTTLIYQIEFVTTFTYQINKFFRKPITLSTFSCDRWIEKIHENRNKIRESLFRYLEKEYNTDFNLYKKLEIIDYLYDITDILFNIKSNYSIISLRKSNFTPEDYELPKLQVEYISIELDRNINVISIYG